MADDDQRIVRILSIDGGGIRGLIPAMLLAKLETDIGQSIADAFHLIAGTSTGGIIAVGLAARRTRNGDLLTPANLVNLYQNQGPQIFDRGWLRRVLSVQGITDELYSARALEHILDDLLGDASLGSVTDPHLLVTSYDIERTKPQFLKSWRAREAKSDFLLRDVARATSAAPTYFEPALLLNLDSALPRKEREFALVDGGVFANDPAMCALAEAQRIYSKADRFVMLSVGTGKVELPVPYEKARDWGKIGWATHVIDVMMDGVSDTVFYQLTRMAGVAGGDKLKYYRAQIDLPGEIQLQDGSKSKLTMDSVRPEHIAQLQRSANELIDKTWNDPWFTAMRDGLKTKKDSYENLGFDPTAV